MIITGLGLSLQLPSLLSFTSLSSLSCISVRALDKEMHSHSIYSFKLTHTSINKLATVFSGIATVSMKDGPHIGVPISISILNQRAMSIWIDPTKTNNHFGNAPIYGTIRLLL
jgi:hypothetical protein